MAARKDLNLQLKKEYADLLQEKINWEILIKENILMFHFGLVKKI